MNLGERFPKGIVRDERKGYSGWIVDSNLLPGIAKTLRDEEHFDYLSSVTGVDYLPDGQFEAVYHLFRTAGGMGEVLKSRAPREKPVLPSLTSIYPGAEFQEREIWDLFGIRFDGHPDLRRILLWEGFAGHPLRKDWHEPLFEEETKPFAARWPEGRPDGPPDEAFIRPADALGSGEWGGDDDQALRTQRPTRPS